MMRTDSCVQLKMSICLSCYQQYQYTQTKRWILIHLNELFSLYKQKLPRAQSRSIFCALCPKWCVLPRTPGTHRICVCRYRQNTKLMIDGSKLNTTYKLLDFPVHNIDNGNCMLNKCLEWPWTRSTTWGFNDNLPHNFQEMDENWKAKLITQLLLSDEFLQALVEKLMPLKPHHFISKVQSQ